MGGERVCRLEGITLLDECGVDSVCCFYNTVFSYERDESGDSDHNKEDGGGEAILCLTIWKVETVQNKQLRSGRDSPETKRGDSGIDSLLELDLEFEECTDNYNEGDVVEESRMEDVNLLERELSTSLEKGKKRMSKRSEERKKETEEVAACSSRVYRFEFNENCLFAALNNLIPIERR